MSLIFLCMKFLEQILISSTNLQKTCELMIRNLDRIILTENWCKFNKNMFHLFLTIYYEFHFFMKKAEKGFIMLCLKY